MHTQPSFAVQFQPIGKRVTVTAGSTLLDAARLAGIDLTAACGGEGNCGQCRVLWLAGEVSPVTADEDFLLTEAERQEGYRLACCTQVHGEVKVHVPRDSMISGQRLQVESNLHSIPPEPLIRAYPVSLEQPTLQDIRSDVTRLAQALETEHGLREVQAGQAMVRSLPGALRAARWQVNAFVRGSEVIAACPLGQRPLGLAVDLGTTKIAASLVDLESGQALASGGAPNPQISYGEDLISRLNYAIRNPQGGALLADKVRQAINDLLGELARQAGVERGQVAEGCIVGNTAMSHLLLEFPVRQLATAPYVAAASDALDVPAGELGLGMAAGARIHIPPAIGGYVGADHVAMVLASSLDESDKITLGVDIGTNTEICLRLPAETFLTSTSCASGPAFEGAHIRDGMRAASGAIEKVRLDGHEADGTPIVELTTIDDQPAVGLCGSGILDTVAELHRVGYLNSGGRFQRERPGLRSGEQGTEFVLVPAARSGSGRDIVITQKDVNEIQLAKGAIQAGLNVLLESTGTPPEAVQEVMVAGAFGSFINIQNTIAMGLFPHLPNAQYRQVGNAAALGARWILISQSARRRAQAIAQRTRYLELTTYPKFSRHFALAMRFPHQEND